MKWISVKDKLPNDPSYQDEYCEYDHVYVVGQGFQKIFGIACYKDNKWEIIGNEGASDCGMTEPLESDQVMYWARFERPNWDKI